MKSRFGQRQHLMKKEIVLLGQKEFKEGDKQHATLQMQAIRASTNQLKLSGETVDDKGFYNDFFKAVERELPKH